MAFERGRFGIEYNADRRGDDSPNLFLRALGVAMVAALVSLAFTIVARVRANRAEEPAAAPPAESAPGAVREPPPPEPPPPGRTAPPPRPSGEGDAMRRAPKLRNLLLRLEEAERRHDVAMAVSTIEMIRSMPGDPAADLSDSLARRLGDLNMRWLFGGGVSPWTADVSVKRGENASRIAHEHGSTLASLQKLNGGGLDRLSVGQKMKVMDHPRFNLVVRRRPRIADLQLNGKFFKRYYLTAPVTGEVGAYETPERLRRLLADKGVSLKPGDRAELEMLVPKGASVTIAEF